MNAAIQVLEQALATAKHNEIVFRSEDITGRAEAAAAEAAELTMALTRLRVAPVIFPDPGEMLTDHYGQYIKPAADPCCGDRGCCD